MLDTTHFLWYSSVAVQFLFCVYLVWTRLARSFPTFTIYLALSVIVSLCATYFMRGAQGARLPLSYTYYWLCAQPVILLAQAAVVLEVHASMWKGHESVVRQTRPLFLFALLTALVAAAIPVRAELNRAESFGLIPLMHFEFLVKRYVSSVLAIFLILSAVLFIAVVRDAWQSSLLRHEGMLAAYLGLYATAAFIIEMGVQKSVVNDYVAAGLTLCFVIWTSVFRPQGALVAS
jgi:hypothetical protein